MSIDIKLLNLFLLRIKFELKLYPSINYNTDIYSCGRNVKNYCRHNIHINYLHLFLYIFLRNQFNI